MSDTIETSLLVYALVTWALLIVILVALVAVVGRSRRSEAVIHQLHADLNQPSHLESPDDAYRRGLEKGRTQLQARVDAEEQALRIVRDE